MRNGIHGAKLYGALASCHFMDQSNSLKLQGKKQNFHINFIIII
jgi:hypothetical protein